MPRASVQVVVTSPPYNVKKPYAGYEDNMEYLQYLNFMRRVFTQVHHVLKDSGVCFVNIANCKKNQFKAFDLAYLLRDIGFLLVDSIIWHKPNPRYLNTKRMLTNAYEFVFMFAKTRKYSISPLNIGIPRKDEQGLKCRGNVWSINKVFKNQFVGFKHCAMFPEELPELCVKLCSNPGDLILDPFMGSGTTAVAAKKLGRHFIGFEISTEYIKISQERLKKTLEVKHEETIACPIGLAISDAAICSCAGL